MCLFVSGISNAFFILGLNGDKRCTFSIGDGVGKSEVKIGTQRGISCIDACMEKRKTDPTINGVTVWSDTTKGGCWCERLMKSKNTNKAYKSCFLGMSYYIEI